MKPPLSCYFSIFKFYSVSSVKLIIADSMFLILAPVLHKVPHDILARYIRQQARVMVIYEDR